MYVDEKQFLREFESDKVGGSVVYGCTYAGRSRQKRKGRVAVVVVDDEHICKLSERTPLANCFFADVEKWKILEYLVRYT